MSDESKGRQFAELWKQLAMSVEALLAFRCKALEQRIAELERELSESKAEVEKLRAAVSPKNES